MVLSAYLRHRSSSALIPFTQNSRKMRTPFSRIWLDIRRLCAITGIITFSSNWPAWPAMLMVRSFPTTWKHTMLSISGTEGFTLPGMMLEPG